MREIKFRGLNPVTKEMIYGQLIKTDCKYKTSEHGFTECHIARNKNRVDTDCHLNAHERGVKAWCSVVVPETVGQFTGLTDANGVEIYETDSLRCPDGYTYIVKFTRGCFVAENPRDSNDFYFLNDLDFEVVGNIHENKEEV